MTLEQLVPILDLCQQLKDAGFPQDTAMYWQRSTMHKDHPVSVHVKGDNELGGIEDFFEDICAAPTAEEILKELPRGYNPTTLLNMVRDWYEGKSLVGEAAQAYLWWKK